MKDAVIDKKRQDTRCESQGAEFLVLGNLMINGIWCYKTYTNMPGYDLIAVSPESGKNCKIQVKSRWATNANENFPLKNLDCDFVVFVRLNRGNGPTFNNRGDIKIKSPQYWIVSIKNAETGLTHDKFDTCRRDKIINIDNLENQWELIKEFLK